MFAVFVLPTEAVAAACEIQCAICQQSWPERVPMRVRVAIHTGETGGDYRGPHINRAARLRAIAHGGQIPISAFQILGLSASWCDGNLPAKTSEYQR